MVARPFSLSGCSYCPWRLTPHHATGRQYRGVHRPRATGGSRTVRSGPPGAGPKVQRPGAAPERKAREMSARAHSCVSASSEAQGFYFSAFVLS